MARQEEELGNPATIEEWYGRWMELRGTHRLRLLIQIEHTGEKMDLYVAVRPLVEADPVDKGVSLRPSTAVLVEEKVEGELAARPATTAPAALRSVQARNADRMGVEACVAVADLMEPATTASATVSTRSVRVSAVPAGRGVSRTSAASQTA